MASMNDEAKTVDMERCEQLCPECKQRCMTLVKGMHIHWHFVGDTEKAHQWRVRG